MTMNNLFEHFVWTQT